MSGEISETAKYWMALSSVKGVGPKTIRKLINRFGSTEKVLSAPIIEIARMVKFNLPMAQEIAQTRTRLDSFEHFINQVSKTGIHVLCPDSREYPVLLKDIENFPPVLYKTGAGSINGGNAVAIVGTRTPTNYGSQMAEKMATWFVERGFTIVSGLAKGIDTAAHRGALKANGKTLAILGSGLKMVYPRENLKLVDEICIKGAVISECHPNELVSGQRLIQRNRLISGICSGIILVEPRRSGALNAAQWALKQNKHIFVYDPDRGELLPATLNREVIFINSLNSLESVMERLANPKKESYQINFF
jgi:DNA processing protein